MNEKMENGQCDIRDVLEPFCQNKRVVLVGNAGSLLEQCLGSRIDTFDVVVRMNHGYPRTPYFIHTGRRTDIWVCAYNDKSRQVQEYDRFRPRYAVRLNNDTHIHPRMRSVFLCWDMQNWQAVKEWMGIEKYPSTGLVSLYFFLEFLKLPQVALAGFDFFVTNNFYKPLRGPHPIARRYHEPEREHLIVEKWISEKRIRRLPAAS